jgi:hypothetical protein
MLWQLSVIQIVGEEYGPAVTGLPPLPLGHCGTTEDSAINDAGLMI